MEAKEESSQYFEDLTAEPEEEAQTSKKPGLPRKGHFSNYTHFISIPLLSEDIQPQITSFQVTSLSLNASYLFIERNFI